MLEIAGARATIRLNRPKHLNRLQAEDLGALVTLFDRIEADPETADDTAIIGLPLMKTLRLLRERGYDVLGQP